MAVEKERRVEVANAFTLNNLRFIGSDEFAPTVKSSILVFGAEPHEPEPVEMLKINTTSL